MISYRNYLCLLSLLAPLSLAAQVRTTINNAYSQGYPVSSSVSSGGNVTTSYYDPYGAGYQFPSSQFPSTQFPSASTPTPANYYASAAAQQGAALPPVTFSTAATTVPGAPAAPFTSTVSTPTYGTINPVGVTTTGYSPYYPNYPTTPTATTSLIPSTVLQQGYPQPAFPGTGYSGGGYGTAPTGFSSVRPPQVTATETPANLVIAQFPLQVVAPEEKYAPGLATIKNGRWVVNHVFYNLSPYIGVKVELIKPEDRYTPLSDKQLDEIVRRVFSESRLSTEGFIPPPCSPVLPMFYVVVMAYPCERSCIAMVTAQLYENAKPRRVDFDINGVWQMISWEQQALVVSACEDFEQEVGQTIEKMAREFGQSFMAANPLDETPCFNTVNVPLIPKPPLRNRF